MTWNELNNKQRLYYKVLSITMIVYLVLVFTIDAYFGSIAGLSVTTLYCIFLAIYTIKNKLVFKELKNV